MGDLSSLRLAGRVEWKETRHGMAWHGSLLPRSAFPSFRPHWLRVQSGSVRAYSTEDYAIIAAGRLLTPQALCHFGSTIPNGVEE